jgi:hypothetical protein
LTPKANAAAVAIQRATALFITPVNYTKVRLKPDPTAATHVKFSAVSASSALIVVSTIAA